jgi:hypothetical protein
MNTLWDYFWPLLAAGFVIGGLAATIGFRRDKLRLSLIIGAGATLAAAASWHGPLGAAGRLTARIERQARESLIYYEVPRITAQLHRAPLTRRLILTKPRDLSLTNFQVDELARLFSQLPGVSAATWSTDDAGVPLIVEGAAAALGGFMFGLGLAYLFELRRRYNAQWTW